MYDDNFLMVLKPLSVKKIANKAYDLYSVDENDSIHTTGVNVDDGNYDNGTFLDRDYDLRDKKNIAINLENIGANAIKYKILSTNKHFDDFATEITDDDFDKEEKAETSLSPRSKATGSVEVTGGPSVAASGDLTLSSAVAETKATGTVTCASVQAGDTVTINGLVYTAVTGTKADNTQFSIDTGNNECAADLADSINNDVRAGTLGDVSAQVSTNVVTCTSNQSGTAGNAVTLVSSNGTRLAVSGSGTFTGGVNADQVTVNGLVYTAVAGAKANNTQFSIDTSDTAAATDLANSITNDARTPITIPTIDVTATSSLGVVTVTAPVNAGADGNAIDTVGSANITAEGSTLTGGITSTMTSIKVDGQEILGATVRWRDNVTNTASDIASQINTYNSNPEYTAANVAGVVTITASVNEPSTATIASTVSTMTKTDSNMTGGGAGKATTLEIVKTTPSITAIRLMAKESTPGSAGKIRADIKAQ